MTKTNAINNATSALTINSAYSFPTSDGTSGQVLKTNGSGTLSFGSAGGGTLVFLDNQTASTSTSLAFTTGISSSYDQYLLTWVGGGVSTGAIMKVQLSTDGGSSYISTGYTSGLVQYAWNGNTPTNYNTTSGLIVARPVNVNSCSFQTWLYLPQSSTPGSSGQQQYGNTLGTSMGDYPTNITTNAFQITIDSGTFSGEFYLYGLSNS